MRKGWKNKSVKQLIEDNKSLSFSSPVEIIQELTRNIVLEAFTKGWEGPPYDIIELAKMRGIEVLPNEMVRDARIIPKPKGKFLIEYNPFQNSSRINFSLAHEIGHTLFKDCAETIRHRSLEMEDSSWELEFLCNIAAAEILLPYAIFSKDANDLPLSMESLMLLADKYQASLESLFIRFCEVVDKPCLAMLATFNSKGQLKVQYSVKSDSCLIDVKEGYTIPEDSRAYECSNSGWTSHDLEEWEMFGNAKYRVYSVGLPAVRKHVESRVGIFLVPEFYDETPSSGLYMVNGDATVPRTKKPGNKIIAQVVNTSAGLGFGFGRAMSTRFPSSKKALQNWKKSGDGFVLGNSQLVKVDEDTFVCQMIAQKGIMPKHGVIPLKYSSLHKCLTTLRLHAERLHASVHMPLIGAGQAKGDWEIIQGMIYQELVKNGINVAVYVLPGSRPKKNQATALTLFNEQLVNE